MGSLFGNKTFRWILIGAISYIVLNVATLLYCYRVVHDNILGWTIDGITANRIFQISYQWDGDLSAYKIHFGQFAKDNSPCHTSLYCLENIHDGGKREALIIAHIPELMYYRPTGIDIEEVGIKKSLIKVITTHYDDGVVQTAIFPLLTFNSRIFPKGERLRVYGIDTSYCRDTVLGEWAVKILEGDFSEIGFEVVPNDGFIKNIPQAIGFAGFRKHGVLLFLRDKENRTILMIQFVESVKGDEYKPYLDSLLEKLPALSIKKL
jgi:hypothetical protein